ncbi:thiamine biosynthesis protein ApbE [Flavobacterium faecale]|uniref:FAD:protein FMN transferase n=1 Tax=Flavobacterium faecale TaxID=1355330 RepID=A0A2S1LHM0_9FLAO|nr:FAD:protein FMN transferase [Flavobacterium faecale]AWG23254.1 thiamine biosynthesis protein ApbE [Flavobacterium faecale]
MIFINLIIALFFPPSSQEVWSKYQINGFTQGTTYSVTYYAQQRIVSESQLDSIFARIDASLSIYDERSLISQFNDSKDGIVMDTHFKNVIQCSHEIYQDTDGFFDITVLPLMEAWGFGKKGIVPTEPNSELIKEIKKNTGSKLLQIKGNSLSKKNPKVRIDVNGIAQGYSVDVVADFLEQKKIVNYLVEIGGEIRIKGKRQPSGELMKIGIESTTHQEHLPKSYQKIVSIPEGAITTSGNYQKFYESKGKKIAHLMNPKTGYPVQNDLISVTVFAPDAITADGYDNALMAMGLKKAFQFVSKRKKLEAYFIYKDDNGVVKDTATTGFYSFFR